MVIMQLYNKITEIHILIFCLELKKKNQKNKMRDG